MTTRAQLAALGVAAAILLAGAGLVLRSSQEVPASAAEARADQRAVVAVAQAAPAVEPAAPAAAPPVVMGGSAGGEAARIAGPTPKEAPARTLFDEMTHVWQTLNNCGPAAVVMALSTFGVDVSQETARLALRGTDERRGMGPAPVGPWVSQSFGLRSFWRNNGTNDLIKRLVANGFAPMVTQWLYDPTVSRVAHWRTVRGYDDAKGVFYVNDSMRGSMVPLAYDWFGRNWQSFSYRYMVIYRPEDEDLLRAIVGRDWNDLFARQALYERARAEVIAQDTSFAWLAYGEAAYANGVFDEAVAAFERGFATGSASGVFGIRNSYPNALRALGRGAEADAVASEIGALSPVPATVAPAPDPYALYLAIRRGTPHEAMPAP